MAQYAGFTHFGSGGGGIDPSALHGHASMGFTNGAAMLSEQEIFESLPSETNHGHNQDLNGLGDMSMSFGQTLYEPPHLNGFSNTPDGDPNQNPFVHSYGAQPQFRQMQHNAFGATVQSPVSYSGSPHDEAVFQKPRGMLAQASPAQVQAHAHSMQRNSSKHARSPLTPKSSVAAMPGISGHPDGTVPFGAQPIKKQSTNGRHEKSPSVGWMHTPSSLASYPPSSGYNSPLSHHLQNPQIADVVHLGVNSMPAKLGAHAPNSQELKRRKRRESHNLVERRRRDNINERIQDLSKLVPTHRLEDEKVRKLIQNGTPLSPTLSATSQEQATSGLAGPGARRATGVGNITTGLPIDEKDKGPNKGDILNGSVSWTRDLMWFAHQKVVQQEELMNCIRELGGTVPFELIDDEKRMQTELMDAMSKNGVLNFSYSRYTGSGLRVPQHTDYKGDSLNGNNSSDGASVSPDVGDTLDLSGELGSSDHFLYDADEGHEYKYDRDDDMDML